MKAITGLVGLKCVLEFQMYRVFVYGSYRPSHGGNVFRPRSRDEFLGHQTCQPQPVTFIESGSSHFLTRVFSFVGGALGTGIRGHFYIIIETEEALLPCGARGTCISVSRVESCCSTPGQWVLFGPYGPSYSQFGSINGSTEKVIMLLIRSSISLSISAFGF